MTYSVKMELCQCQALKNTDIRSFEYASLRTAIMNRLQS